MNTEIWLGKTLIDPFSFTQEQVNIEAIAMRLSRIYRFGGESLITVAEHSVNVSHLVPRRDALHALLHDAAEALLGDCVRPLKQCSYFVRVINGQVYMRSFAEVEQYILGVIFQSLSMPSSVPVSVKLADSEAMDLETAELFGDVTPRRYLAPDAAEAAFMLRFFELTAERVAA